MEKSKSQKTQTSDAERAPEGPHDHVKILVSVKMGLGIHILSTEAAQSIQRWLLEARIK